MKKAHKTLLLWFVLVCVFFALYNLVAKDASRPDYAAFLADVRKGRVGSVRLEPDPESADLVSLRVQLDDGRSYETRPIALTAALEAVEDARLPCSLRPSGKLDAAFWISLVPVLLIGLIVVFFVRSLKTMGGSKSPGLAEMVQARIEVRPPPTVERTVPDSEPARRFIDAVRDFKEGRDGPRKLLLVGPPGSGKTTLVRQAVAAAGLKWLPLPASDVANVFVGIAAARVRRAFELAAANAPASSCSKTSTRWPRAARSPARGARPKRGSSPSRCRE